MEGNWAAVSVFLERCSTHIYLGPTHAQSQMGKCGRFVLKPLHFYIFQKALSLRNNCCDQGRKKSEAEESNLLLWQEVVDTPNGKTPRPLSLRLKMTGFQDVTAKFQHLVSRDETDHSLRVGRRLTGDVMLILNSPVRFCFPKLKAIFGLSLSCAKVWAFGKPSQIFQIEPFYLEAYLYVNVPAVMLRDLTSNRQRSLRITVIVGPSLVLVHIFTALVMSQIYQGEKGGKNSESGFCWFHFQTVVKIRLIRQSELEVSFLILKPLHEGSFFSLVDFRTVPQSPTPKLPPSPLTKQHTLGSPSHRVWTTSGWGGGNGELH